MRSPRELGLVQQVLRDCEKHDTKAAPLLAAEVVRLLEVDPRCSLPGVPGAGAGLTLLTRKPHPLLSSCLGILLDRQSPVLATIRMQVAFRRKFRSAGDVAREQAAGIDARLAPLLSEMLEGSSAEGMALRHAAAPAGPLSWRLNKERLHRSMVAAAVLRSGLGNPADPAVMKEASAAMHSVYPAREVPRFMRLPGPERRAQLLEVCSITAGIRIFNWDCGTAGHGLLDLPTLVQDAAAVTLGVLRDYLTSVEARLWPATSVLEATCLPRVPELPEHVVELLKDSIILLRQQQQFLRRLLRQVEDASAEAQRLAGLLRAGLDHVHSVVQSKSAVPTIQVYPQFMSLASTWESLETQAVVISKAGNLQRRLSSYTQDVRMVEDTLVDEFLRAAGLEPLSDTERDAEAQASLEPAEQSRPRTPSEQEGPACEMDGFCPWFLSKTSGGLFAGCPALGFCEVDGKLYCLSSLEAIEQFSSDPARWIKQAYGEIRRRPALVGLLRLRDQLLALKLMPSPCPSRAAPVEVRHASAQTDANRTRHHNGSRCLLGTPGMASSKVGTATQTNSSAYRRSSGAQTFPMRDIGVQCPRHAACAARRTEKQSSPPKASSWDLPGAEDEPEASSSRAPSVWSPL